MKKILLAFFLSVYLISCFKTANRNLGSDNSANGYIKYQLNDYPFEITGGYYDIPSTGIGVYGRKQAKSAIVEATRYTLFGQLGINKTINIIIATDSLKVGAYTTSSNTGEVTFAKVDTVQFSSNRAIDYLTVNISRYSEGTIDGSFAGRLSSAKTINGTNNYTDGLITNGVFQNIRIQY